MTDTPARSVDRTSLDVFRNPRSVTVLGASANTGKWGHWLARGALRGAARRRVHLVNRHGAVIEGHSSVPSVDDIDEPLDLVVLCVPATALPDAVQQALERGARGFVGITAGLDRAVAEPGAERRLAGMIRRNGARVIGPNCLGIYDAAADLQLAWGDFRPGSLGIVSQSGQLGSELAELAAERGLGVSRFVSVGNQVDVTADEVLEDLIDHDETRVVALYVESFTNGRAMMRTLDRLRDSGKHTLLLTVGASAASRSAAQSHTGSLTSALEVVDAACRTAGAVRVTTPNELVEAAHLLMTAPPVGGTRVAIVGDSGGQGAVAADVLTAAGLRVADLPLPVQGDLAAMLPAEAGLGNPIDLAGAGEQDLHTYATVIEVLLAEPTVDALALTGYFGSYGQHNSTLGGLERNVAGRIADSVRRHRKPVALHSMCRDSATISLLRGLGVPVYHTVESAALALAVGGRIGNDTRRDQADKAQDAPAVLREPTPVPQGYLAAREFLSEYGVMFPPAHPVTDTATVAQAASRLSAPYVLKADWILHKTEHRAIHIGLDGPDAASEALADMTARLGSGQYVLEEADTRDDVVEVIVGARRDPSFGPLVLVGGGGVHAELHRDTAVELAPVTERDAARMRRRLVSAALLDGWRGRPGVDTGALDRVVAAVSRLIVERPEFDAIEINPLRVGPSGALAVDALFTASDRQGGADR